MATRYPGALDRDPNEIPDNIGDSDTLDSPNHATIHNNVNGAVLQIEEKLGIGDTTASAGALLHGTAAGTSAWSADPSVVGSLSVAKDSADAVVNVTAHHDTEATAAELTLRKSDGSKASPALVDDDAVLGKIMFQGYDGNSYATGAVIQALADGTPADGEMPTELLFQVTPASSETPATALTISPAKKATFAGAVEIDGATDLDGVVQIDNTVTVGVDDTGHDVKFFGAAAGKYMLWDEDVNTLIINGKTQFLGDGAWTTWTPAWTNVTIGSATVVAQYVQLDDWVFVKVKTTMAGDSGYSSGSMALTLPVAANSDTGSQWITSVVAPAGTTQYRGEGVITGGKFYLHTSNVGGSYAYQSNVNGGTGVPATWNTSALVYLQGWYRAA
jgi:hypothetical protein